MSRRDRSVLVKCNDACTGCEVVYETIPRSNFIRERWGTLSPACAAEDQAFRAARAAERSQSTNQDLVT